MKDGLSLTPTVLKALAFGPDVGGSAGARRRAVGYLIERVKPDGSIDGGGFGMVYPVYTAWVGARLSIVEIDGLPRVETCSSIDVPSAPLRVPADPRPTTN